jgi:Fibronectin type III domain
MNHRRKITNGKVLSLMGLFVAVAVSVVALPTFASQNVELTWSPSPSPDVVGYNIYYGGAASGGYNSEISVGNTTNVTVSGLAGGTTYYFSAKAVNSSGIESTYSIQSSYLVPSAAAIFGKLIYSGNAVSVAVTGTPGSIYVIQASTNLVNWISLVTNVTPLQFTDTNVGQYRKRFYRAVNMF